MPRMMCFWRAASRTRKKSNPNVEAGCFHFPVKVLCSAPLVVKCCPKATLGELRLEWFLNWDYGGQEDSSGGKGRDSQPEFNPVGRREPTPPSSPLYSWAMVCANTNQLYLNWDHKDLKIHGNALMTIRSVEPQLQTGKEITCLILVGGPFFSSISVSNWWEFRYKGWSLRGSSDHKFNLRLYSELTAGKL